MHWNKRLLARLNPGLFYDCFRLQSLKVSQQLKFFTGWGRQPHAQPPTWRARVSLFVWIITFDLSGMGNPTSSYATASIGLRIIWTRKPHHYVKVRIPTGRNTYIYIYIHIEILGIRSITNFNNSCLNTIFLYIENCGWKFELKEICCEDVNMWHISFRPRLGSCCIEVLRIFLCALWRVVLSSSEWYFVNKGAFHLIINGAFARGRLDLYD
jgi:hypothetical protein